MSQLIHRFDSGSRKQLFVVDGSRIYDLASDVASTLDTLLPMGDQAIEEALRRYGLGSVPYIDDTPLANPPMRSLSLAVAQTCNLACGYCYAMGGEFGGNAKTMPWPVAQRAVLRLLDSASAGDRINLSFLGGEPLVARALIRRITEFATAEARSRQIAIGFSVTTNGTLLCEGDADFFEKYGFAVTVSIDGTGATHDRLRPFRGGSGSYKRIIDRVSPLLRRQRAMQVSARITVTPLNLGLSEMLEELIDLGFHSVGFSPLLASPSRNFEMQSQDLDRMLGEMITCGRRFEAEALADRPYPFSNIMEALVQIHRGTHRPYPCGAGAGYFGVSADGGLFACHRFVEDPKGAFGDVDRGVDTTTQQAWLAGRHVHQQEPCRSCWARYLCGGGCHHEVINRGRPACDFIRGWLHHCLTVYGNLTEHRPDYFTAERSSA